MGDVLLRPLVRLSRKHLAHASKQLDVAVAHERHLHQRLVAGDDGREVARHVERAKVRLLRLGRADDARDESCERLHERDEHRRRNEVEERVHRRHRRGHVRIARYAVDNNRVRVVREERRSGREHHGHEERNQDDRSDDVEERVGEGSLPGLGGPVERREPGGHGRSDVHSEYGRGGGLEGKEPLLRKRHRDRSRRSGGLHDGREHKRDEDALGESPRRRRVERPERVNHRRHRADRLHALLHPV